jgi:hypothetical protein
MPAEMTSRTRLRRAPVPGFPTRCENCASDTLPVHAKGLCGRCCPVQDRIWQIEKWDLQRLPNAARMLALTYPTDVPRMKKDWLLQFRSRLEELRLSELSRKEPVSSVALELLLKRLASELGIKDRRIAHGVAPVFDDFGSKRRKVLYEILANFLFSTRWRGINWARYMNRENGNLPANPPSD